MEFRAIILRIIWRLAPALWLDWVIRRLIDWAIATLNDQQDWLNASPKNCFWFGGWLAVIEARVDELVNLKAHLLLNWRCEPRDVPPHHPAPAARTIEDCLLRLARLVRRFEDSDRLAERRAKALLRLHDDRVIHLIPDHRPAACSSSSSSSSSSRSSIETGAAASRRTAASSSSSSSIKSGAAARYYDSILIRGPPPLEFSLEELDDDALVPDSSNHFSNGLQPAGLVSENANPCLAEPTAYCLLPIARAKRLLTSPERCACPNPSTELGLRHEIPGVLP